MMNIKDIKDIKAIKDISKQGWLALIIALITILVLIAIFTYSKPKHSSSQSNNNNNNNTEPTVNTTLTVRPKKNDTDSDLVVRQSYTATINGTKVAVPVSKDTSPSTLKGTQQAVLVQDIDVTQLVKPLVPKWELGVGLGVHKDDVYIPVSIQRNYKIDRALAFEVHLDKHLHPNGLSVTHKWCF